MVCTIKAVTIILLIFVLFIGNISLANATSEPEPLKVSYPYFSDINALDFSPDGKLLALGYDEAYVRVWNIENGELINDPSGVMEQERLMRTLGKHDRTRVYSVKFSPDGKYILSGGALYDIESKDANFDERDDEGIEVSEIKLWDVESGECIREYYMEDNFVRSVTFSPDGNTYAASYKNDKINGTNIINIWGTETGEILKSIQSPNDEVASLSFTPDGKYLVVSYANYKSGHRIVFWDLENNIVARVISANAYLDLEFSDDGSVFSGTSWSGDLITVWDTKSGDTLRKFRDLKYSTVSDLSPNGKFLVGAADRDMIIWNISSGKKVANFYLGQKIDSYECVEFSPDMKYIASSTQILAPSNYGFSHETFVTALNHGVSYTLMRHLHGNDVVFLWDFQDIKENEYKEGFWDLFGDLSLSSLLIIGSLVASCSFITAAFVLMQSKKGK